MNFLKYCGIGATSRSQQQDQTSESSSGTPAPTHAAPNDTNNNNNSASPTKNSAEDEQEDLTQQTEPMDHVEPDTIHTPAHDLSDKVDEQENPTQQTEPMDHVEPDAALAAAFLNLSDADDESAVPLVPTSPPSSRGSRLQNKPIRPKPTGALSSSTDQEQNPSRLLGPANSTQPEETHSSKKMTDSKKRKKPPTKQGGNPKQLKKTNTDKKGPSEPIEINSDDESLSDESSDSGGSSDALNDLLDELSDEPENSDDEGQKTDDEKHLPRPPKKPTDGELKVTGSKKISHPTDELEEGLGEDEAGILKDGEVPAHIHIGDTDEIVSKGPKPDHNTMAKPSVKDRADLEQGKPKKEVPIKTFQLMIHYAMRTVGLDSDEYPVIFNMAVKYISSTNFFQAKVFSGWGAQKRINTEADLLRAASARYPHYVLTMAPDLILCLIAAMDLRPDAYGEPNGRGITIIGGFHVFNHLRSAIELGETISWGKGSRGQLLMLGRRGEEESVPLDLPVPKSTKAQTKKRKKLSEAVPEPFPANAVNVQQIPTGFMQPYPFQPTLPTAPITKVITAEEWDRRNAHWLDQLMDPESTKEMFGSTIEEEVTEEIFPLISKARRNVLNRWAKSEDFNLDSRLLEAPILPQVEVEDGTSQEILNVETDRARRSIRAIETAALSLPKAHQTAVLIKQHTDRLFACRDHEIDNHTLMAQSVAKLRESSSVTAATLNAAFETNETRLRSRVDPAQTAREKGLEALEADMQNALKTPTVDGSADQLVLFLKSHWRMRDDEISDWKDMANSVCHTAKEAGHPINQTDQEACNNHDWDSLQRLAITRGGKALVALLNMERCAPDEAFLGRRNEWYKETLTDEEYGEWSGMFSIEEEPQAGGEQP
ncbi:hypothetical protein FOMG_13487 [Fusarium oxysporum f. sp. melonis 26406]|uniref:Uncharacterized protein n=1 Tax=Fusarium oxysporum f. sp. melonis 26406 TaxID=1089452 RepID=W9ZFU4_FUSOX|nr:hypothetical protein FOMG_13487 [Fusarium oxysporum f. sp. melonis 26406]